MPRRRPSPKLEEEMRPGHNCGARRRSAAAGESSALLSNMSTHRERFAVRRCTGLPLLLVARCVAAVLVDRFAGGARLRHDRGWPDDWWRCIASELVDIIDSDTRGVCSTKSQAFRKGDVGAEQMRLVRAGARGGTHEFPLERRRRHALVRELSSELLVAQVEVPALGDSFKAEFP